MSVTETKYALGGDVQLMNGEYRSLSHIEVAPHALVYRALDPLDEPHIITETFSPELCSRTADLHVKSALTKGKKWQGLLHEHTQKLDKLSRLVHPALQGIVQKFHENETNYIATAIAGSRTVDSQMSEGGFFYQPNEITQICVGLIDLLNYLHAFDVYGLAILPETLILSAQDASPRVLLRHYIDGTVEFDLLGKEAALQDCVTLARTLHLLITGQPPATPYVPLSGTHPAYSPKLLTSIDQLLSNRNAGKFASAAYWLEFVKEPVAVQAPEKTLVAPKKSKLGLFSSVAVIALVALGAAYYWNTTQINEVVSVTAIDASADRIEDVAVVNEPNLDELFRSLDDPEDGPTGTETTVDKAATTWHVNLPIVMEEITNAQGKKRFALKMNGTNRAFKQANPWYTDGTILETINDVAVTKAEDLDGLIRDHLEGENASPVISLTVHDAELPLQRQVALVPSAFALSRFGPLTLKQSAVQNLWSLSVEEIEPDFKTSLQIGDILVNARSDNDTITTLESFRNYATSLQNGTITTLESFRNYATMLQKAGTSTLNLNVIRSDDTVETVQLEVDSLLSDATNLAQ